MIHIIKPYHGELPKKVSDVLNTIATPIKNEDRWVYSGTLDTLYSELGKVNAMFYAYPKELTVGDIIYVTHHNSWSSR